MIKSVETIVAKEKGDSARLMDFGMKLSEYCGIPNALFFALAPSLFMTALESVSAFKADKGRSK